VTISRPIPYADNRDAGSKLTTGVQDDNDCLIGGKLRRQWMQQLDWE